MLSKRRGHDFLQILHFHCNILIWSTKILSIFQLHYLIQGSYFFVISPKLVSCCCKYMQYMLVKAFLSRCFSIYNIFVNMITQFLVLSLLNLIFKMHFLSSNLDVNKHMARTMFTQNKIMGSVYNKWLTFEWPLEIPKLRIVNIKIRKAKLF